MSLRVDVQTLTHGHAVNARRNLMNASDDFMTIDEGIIAFP
ncbi:hypothetical protein HMPREF9622_02021 [Cutibacterium modestum HL037PA3]|nr:hypothetical protein HMPREF9622_02021 [Cutibacterium modestum HL037PA3]